MRKRKPLPELNPVAVQMLAMSIRIERLKGRPLLETEVLDLVEMCSNEEARDYLAWRVAKAEARALADATKEWG